MIAKIKRLLGWVFWLLVVLPFGYIVVSFAVFNRQRVAADIFPLPFSIEMPLYLFVLGSLLIGFLAGSLLLWIASARYRVAARREAKRAEKAEQDLAALRAAALKPLQLS